jgi:DNA repair exonuclease SbcCD ATPase subunit
MTDSLAAAIQVLYRAPLGDFVAERKRLAAEAKAAGHAEQSSQIGKLGRPSVSAWATNQLWWQQREAFAALIEAAARVKRGDREAGKQHRELLAQLRDQAAEILKVAGNAASETTLRRVTTTLSALAASGGFAPDPEGALSADRDPPGFEALEGAFAAAPSVREQPADPAARKAEAAERLRAEQAERQRRLEQREKLSAALREAKELRATQQRELSRLRGEVDSAERSLKKTQDLITEIEQQLLGN